MPDLSAQVLIVDDDPAFADLLTYWLEQEQYTCSETTDAKEALEILQKKHFDLLISDINMPGTDGYEFIREVRELTEYAHTPIIIISAEEREENIIRTLNQGADDFISKPCNEKVLLSKVKANLKKEALKKSIYKKNRSRNVNYDEGEVIYCINPQGTSPCLLPDDFRIRSVVTPDALFAALESEPVWLILVDEEAEWAVDIINKIEESVEEEVPVIMMVSSGKKDVREFDYYLLRDISDDYIVDQLRFFIEREKVLKNKYVNALHTATESTAFSFPRITQKVYGDFKVSIMHEPFANMPGGDFYECFSYDDRHKIIFLGDIMGKAWGAWFFVPAYIAYIRSTLKFMSYREFKDIIESPEKILELLNKYLSQDLRFSDVFATLSIAVIDTSENTVTIAGAGALAPILYRKRNNELVDVDLKGLLMGIKEDSSYDEIVLDIEPGDRLLFYTDGYSEAINSETGEMIAREGMKKVFEKFSKKESETALEFEAELLQTIPIETFDDDRSLLLISR